jgi:hypothetical protein
MPTPLIRRTPAGTCSAKAGRILQGVGVCSTPLPPSEQLEAMLADDDPLLSCCVAKGQRADETHDGRSL